MIYKAIGYETKRVLLMTISTCLPSLIIILFFKTNKFFAQSPEINYKGKKNYKKTNIYYLFISFGVFQYQSL